MAKRKVVSKIRKASNESHGFSRYVFNNRELATLLASLRLWQSSLGPDSYPAQANVSEDFGEFFESWSPLTPAEIDELASRININSETVRYKRIQTSQPYVLVTVDGGVADIAENASGVSVDILDFDNLRESDPETRLDALSDREKAYLTKIKWGK